MKSKISGFIDRFFRKEGFNGGYRWTLARVGWLCVYLHHFVDDDWLGDMHDHPGRIISIGLFGKYREETPGGAHIYRAPWERCFPAAHIHHLAHETRQRPARPGETETGANTNTNTTITNAAAAKAADRLKSFAGRRTNRPALLRRRRGE